MRHGLEAFIVKRVAVLLVIFSIVSSVFVAQRLMMLTGLFLGTVVGLVKFELMGKVLSSLLVKTGKKSSVRASIAKFVFMYGFIVVFFIVLASLDVVFFVGTVVGVLLVSFVVMINSITEGLGITRNNFGGEGV